MMSAIQPRVGALPAANAGEAPASGKAGGDAFGSLLAKAEGEPAQDKSDPVDGRSAKMPRSTDLGRWLHQNAEIATSPEMDQQTEQEPDAEATAEDARALLMSLLRREPRPAEMAKASADSSAETTIPVANGAGRSKAAKDDLVETAAVEDGEADAAQPKPETAKGRPAIIAQPARHAADVSYQQPAVGTADAKQVGAEVTVLDGPDSGDAAPVRTDAVSAWSAGRAALPDNVKPEPATPAVTITPMPTTTAPTFDGPATVELVQTARTVSEAEIGRPGSDGQTQTLKLQLKPVELGSVTAILHARDGVLSVELQVESAEAQHRLTHEKEAIGRALRETGLTVEHITVQHHIPATQTVDRDAGASLGQNQPGRGQDTAMAAGGERGGQGSTGGGNTEGDGAHGRGSGQQGNAGTPDRGQPGRYI